jgi:hypothetical protein
VLIVRPAPASTRRIRRRPGRVAGQAGVEPFGVGTDEAEQRRPAAGLPRQAQEVQARYVGDPGLVPDLPVDDDAGNVQPGIVGPVAGRPHDRVHVERGAIGEAGGAAGEPFQPRPEADAATAQGAAAAADDQIAAGPEAAGQPGVRPQGEETGLAQPEEQVTAGDALR